MEALGKSSNNLQHVEACLRAKLDACLSWSEWHDSQIAKGEPVLRKAMQKRANELMADFGGQSLPFRCVRGAHFPLLSFLPRIICFEIDTESLPPVLPPLHMKISVDGRKLRGNSNIGWFVSFDESKLSQSPDGHYTFALADMKEPELASSSVWNEMGLDEAVARLRSGPIQIAGQWVQIHPYLCADWKGLSYIVGFAPANSQGAELVCGWCHVDKDFLKSAWLDGSPFAVSGEYFACQIGAIPSLPLWRARYCAMHGCNRLLDNNLRLVQSLGHKSEIRAIVRQVCPRWGGDIALFPFQTKKFYERSLQLTIASLFMRDKRTITLQSRDGAQVHLAVKDVVLKLLSACNFYWRFSRRQELQEDLAELHAARDDILAVSHACRAELAPTTHYMTSHFITFVSAELSAYHLLQEGAEHHHKTDRRFAGMIFSTSGSATDDRGPMEQLLDQQELHRILLKRRHLH